MTTFELTWQESHNNAHTASTVAEMFQWKIWMIKANLMAQLSYTDASDNPIGSPAGGATCQGSSDSVTGAMDGTDRWTSSYTPSKIVRASADGTAHSWIVLKTAWNLYILIDCVDPGTVNTQFHIGMSLTAYSGGSSTTRPTTSNEFTFGANPAFQTNSIANHHCHAWLATNGEAGIVFSRDGSGFANMCLMFRQLTETHTGDNNNAWGYFEFLDSGSGVLTLAQVLSNGAVSAPGWQSRSATPATAAVVGQATMLAFGASGGTTVISDQPSVDPIDGKDQDQAMRIYVTTASHKSIRGRLQDVVWAPVALTQAKVEPSTGPPFLSTVIGNTMWPWHDASVGPSF